MSKMIITLDLYVNCSGIIAFIKQITDIKKVINFFSKTVFQLKYFWKRNEKGNTLVFSTIGYGTFNNNKLKVFICWNDNFKFVIN